MSRTDDTPVTTTADDYSSDLGKAIWFARAGYRIPLALAIRLREQGFDANEIQATHR
jgi:hypothetical protein